MSRPLQSPVVWHSPSHDAQGSVPLGNGEIALNAWITKKSELCFYIARTDAWGDNGRLLKLGLVRVVLDPAPDPAVVRQSLDLETATWTVRFGPYADRLGGGEVELRLWVDARHPVILVDIEAENEVSALARVELWRTEPMELEELQVSDIMLDRSRPEQKHAPTVVEPDTLLQDLPDWVGWYHHNRKSVGPALTAELQGLEDFAREDPLLNRIFGAAILTPEANRVSHRALRAQAAKRLGFQIPVLSQHPSSPEKWLTALEDLIEDTRRADLPARRTAHESWWREFWQRSWLQVSGDTPAAAEEAELVSRSYGLQRYVQACAGRGRYPIKFNGSLFTVPFPGKQEDADYRRWGPGYWWQNTRLPYFNMCAAGDYDMLQPLFRMYAQDMLALWRHRTRRYFGYDGIFFSECVYFWGDVFTETYGWTPYAEREDPLQESGYHKWEWVGGLELAFLMLDYCEHREDWSYLERTVLPFAELTLRFFDNFYAADEQGKLVMHPSQALETWWECTNPMPEIAGIRAVIQRLLALPEGVAPPLRRASWKELLDRIPELPVREEQGVRMLAPADAYADLRNVENAELYAVFPFRLHSFEKDAEGLARSALERQQFRGFHGWRQNDLFLAYMGLGDAAADAAVSRAGNRNHDCQGEEDPARAMQNVSRFPGFWGPNYDWTPDQCHGGVLNATLQSMLLQCDGRKIHLCPAWPRRWNACFKLHAPFSTTIEGEIRDGKLTKCRVEPEERAQDVIVWGGFGQVEPT